MTAAPRAATAPRILDAARSLVSRGGPAAVSMGDVAAAAGVSKALVHYHFHDKDSLLTALVERTGTAILRRAEEWLRRPAREQSLDGVWAALDEELRAGDVRTLLALEGCDSERVRACARRIAAARRELQARQAGAVFANLGLAPRLPPALMAETIVAFSDGLVLSHARDHERPTRPAFDALWLALLTLAE